MPFTCRAVAQMSTSPASSRWSSANAPCARCAHAAPPHSVLTRHRTCGTRWQSPRPPAPASARWLCVPCKREACPCRSNTMPAAVAKNHPACPMHGPQYFVFCLTSTPPPPLPAQGRQPPKHCQHGCRHTGSIHGNAEEYHCHGRRREMLPSTLCPQCMTRQTPDPPQVASTRFRLPCVNPPVLRMAFLEEQQAHARCVDPDVVTAQAALPTCTVLPFMQIRKGSPTCAVRASD